MRDCPVTDPGEGGTPVTPSGPSWLYGLTARLFSLLLAAALSGVMLFVPTLLVGDDVNHGLLTLLMWGIAAGFVHGVGYVPVHHIWRLLLGPLVGWGLMLGVGVVLLLAR
jgi:predicted membrane protein